MVRKFSFDRFSCYQTIFNVPDKITKIEKGKLGNVRNSLVKFESKIERLESDNKLKDEEIKSLREKLRGK